MSICSMCKDTVASTVEGVCINCIGKSIEYEKRPLGALLMEAHKLITGERQDSYGAPDKNWKDIAAIWTTYLRSVFNTEDITITPRDAANLMILLKVIRAGASFDSDNYIDICGYADIAGTVLSKD